MRGASGELRLSTSVSDAVAVAVRCGRWCRRRAVNRCFEIRCRELAKRKSRSVIRRKLHRARKDAPF